MEVRARVPQKQGLKQQFGRETWDLVIVRARVPQKQGLKPPDGDLALTRSESGREFHKNKD